MASEFPPADTEMNGHFSFGDLVGHVRLATPSAAASLRAFRYFSMTLLRSKGVTRGNLWCYPR